MEITEKDYLYIEKNWTKVPLCVLANKYQMTELEFIKLLRKKGIATNVQPIELQFIKENFDKMPAASIQEKLGMTKTQFSQIYTRTLGLKSYKSMDDWTIDEAINKTKWLLEEKLNFTVDDFLPREIRRTHFTENNLYGALRLAENISKKDSYYKNFTAIAYLICHAYPNMFRPFQFANSKNNDYFRGNGGRKNYLNAVIWILENKFKIDIENLDAVANNQYFLRTKDLGFYGLGHKVFKEHFNTQKELTNALLKQCGNYTEDKVGRTDYLRMQLESVEINPYKCFIDNCAYNNEYGVDIHHIIPRESKSMIKINIHSPYNLIPLCPNHHKKAKQFDWKQLLDKEPETWRDTIVDYLKE